MRKDLSPSLARKFLQEEQAIIIDVRTKEEFEDKHVPLAVNINVSSPDFIEKIQKLDVKQAYLLYCHMGVRSAKAALIMEEIGFKKVFNVAGDIIDDIEIKKKSEL